MPFRKVRTQIHRFLQSHKQQMIQLTRELCSIPTENPPGKNYETTVDYLQGYVETLGLETQKIYVPEKYQRAHTPQETWGYPRFNLLARWELGAAQTLHFNSHIDVVPATEDWETDPYQPVLRQGRLYGRGTCDMKGSLVSSIFAVHALRECGLHPAWNIELSFTADEEIGGECGVGYLVKKKLIRPDAAVICEGGKGNTIAYGHRGVLWADIQIEGKAAHGSSPQSGINAFEKGLGLAEKIRALKADFSQRKSAHITNRAEFRYPSMTMGGLSGGGQKVNIVPDRFHFTLDRRLIPEEDVTQVENEIHSVIKAAMKEDKQLKAAVKILMAFNAGLTNPDAPICRAAKQAVTRVLQQKSQIRLFGAFTDLHFLTNHAACPTIGYGVDGEGLHSSCESIAVASLAQTAEVYAEIALNLSGD